MKYIVLRLFGELFALIGEGSNEYEIASWASAKYCEWNEYGNEIEDFLAGVNLMNEPGFEMSILDIFRRGFGILQSEFNIEPNLEGEFGMYDELEAKYRCYFEVKRDVKYPVLNLCGQLFLLIANEKSPNEIAKWSYATYSVAVKNGCSHAMLQFLSDLAVIDTPGFEMSVSEIINKSINILQMELNTVCKIYNDFQPL